MPKCHIIAITKETDTVDGVEGNWVKVETDKDGSVVEGWVFSHHLSLERGGCAFNIPEDLAWWQLGWY